jgi:23S rRNA pseudouridine2605 synthase
VRKAMEAVGLTVNRLIRVSYGPFVLADLKPGQVDEVPPDLLEETLGILGFKPATRQAKLQAAPKSHLGRRGPSDKLERKRRVKP